MDKPKMKNAKMKSAGLTLSLARGRVREPREATDSPRRNCRLVAYH